MKLETVGDGFVIYETGRQNNGILYKKGDDLSKHSKTKLCVIEDFLLTNKQEDEAVRISLFLGKIIRFSKIPELIPTGNYIIDTSLDYLIETIDRYVCEYGLDLNPDFQRHHVWSKQQRVAYVEFVLQGGKSAPIYFNCEGWMSNYSKTMVVVDGKQRLTTLLMFLNNEFPVFKNLDSEGVGFYAREFDRFGRTIQICINDLPNKRKVLEWYLQINKGQVAHTLDEIKKVEEMLLELDENK